MTLGALHVRFDTGDLGLERFNPRLELFDGDGVQVLLCKSDERIVRLAWEEFVQVHTGIVDPRVAQVNKPGLVTKVPTSMKAVVAPPTDGTDELVIVERPVPEPVVGEVLVKVAAAGVNRPDILQRKGLYPPPPGASDVLGLEIAGEVVDGPDELMGRNVCALVAGGGYAQYCVAPMGTCLPVPRTISLTEAAAMPETLFTVWVNLFERGFAADGDWALVHGGTSGIGTMAIALGQLFGVNVIVTCGTDAKCARALELGAAAAINYREQDFVEEVHKVTDRVGVNVVVDMVGGDYVPRNLACLAKEGRHVSIAVQRGATAELPIVDVMRRRLILTGSTLRPRSIEFKTMVADEIARSVWPYVEGGRLKPVIDKTFPLSEAAAAHARMEAGEHVGKIVLQIG
jgi:putative PIG3 family NAD(P)H quinone oxidoreductase